MNSLWDELMQKTSRQLVATLRGSDSLYASRLKSGVMLCLTSWSDLLALIARHLASGHGLGPREDVRQMQALCHVVESIGENEVISIPAGRSISTIENTRIHACPGTGSYTRYRRTRYATFRAKGGAMKAIYEIQLVTKFFPRARCVPRWIKPKIRKRLANYMKDRVSAESDWFGNRRQQFSFYVLSERVTFRLPHAPECHIQGHTYFRLDDLRNPKLRNPPKASELEEAVF